MNNEKYVILNVYFLSIDEYKYIKYVIENNNLNSNSTEKYIVVFDNFDMLFHNISNPLMIDLKYNCLKLLLNKEYELKINDDNIEYLWLIFNEYQNIQIDNNGKTEKYIINLKEQEKYNEQTNKIFKYLLNKYIFLLDINNFNEEIVIKLNNISHEEYKESSIDILQFVSKYIIDFYK
jgi:hypothetical protein